MALKSLVAARRSYCLLNSPAIALFSRTRSVGFSLCFHKLGFHTTPSNNGPIRIDMPALSPTMEEGTIMSWAVEEGSEVSIGDALCEVETDKAVVTMEAFEDGILAKILLPAGTSNVKIGTPIAIIAEDSEDLAEATSMKVTSQSNNLTPVSTDTILDTAPVSNYTQPRKDMVHRLISPAVRQLLEQYRIDVSKVASSGPHNILLKGDVLQHIKRNNLSAKQHPASPPVLSFQSTTTTSAASSKSNKTAQTKTMTSSAKYEDVDLTGMRKVIAKRLTESKQTIPHTYSSIDCTINNVLKLRKDLLKSNIKVSVNDFIIKAAAKTLQNFPQVNTVWKKEEAVPSKTVDVSVAVATDTGLVTPIVKNADNKGLSTITNEIRELAGRARNGKLRPGEFQGGSFTISNLGMFGIKEFTAIINPPQVCIMAIGGSRIMPSKCPETDEIKASNVITVTMSSDARIVDAKSAEEFLTQFKINIENPLLMI